MRLNTLSKIFTLIVILNLFFISCNKLSETNKEDLLKLSQEKQFDKIIEYINDNFDKGNIIVVEYGIYLLTSNRNESGIIYLEQLFFNEPKLPSDISRHILWCFSANNLKFENINAMCSYFFDKKDGGNFHSENYNRIRNFISASNKDSLYDFLKSKLLKEYSVNSDIKDCLNSADIITNILDFDSLNIKLSEIKESSERIMEFNNTSLSYVQEKKKLDNIDLEYSNASTILANNNIIELTFLYSQTLENSKYLVSVGGYKTGILKTFNPHSYTRGNWYRINVNKDLNNYEEYPDQWGFNRKVQVYVEAKSDDVEKLLTARKIYYDYEDNKKILIKTTNELTEKINMAKISLDKRLSEMNSK